MGTRGQRQAELREQRKAEAVAAALCPKALPLSGFISMPCRGKIEARDWVQADARGVAIKARGREHYGQAMGPSGNGGVIVNVQPTARWR